METRICGLCYQRVCTCSTLTFPAEFSTWVSKAYRDALVPGHAFSIANMHVAYVAGQNREALRNAKPINAANEAVRERATNMARLLREVLNASHSVMDADLINRINRALADHRKAMS